MKQTGSSKSPTEVGVDNEVARPNKRAASSSINIKATNRGTTKRKSVYITEDLVREKSPTPPTEQDSQNQASSESQTTTSMSRVLLNGKRQVQCNICKRLMTESRLANHIRLMHLDKSKDSSKDSSSNSKGGAKTKDPTKEYGIFRPYKCEHCGKSYAIKYTWQQHVKTHTEGRPKCPECGDTFATAFGLFRHRVRNHNIEHNFKTFTCEECSKGFFSVSELTLHQQRHSSNKEFVCPQCKKAFSVKGNLRLHMRTHAKEKLYKCDICLNSFSHPYSLVSHRRIHTNDLPYHCDVCNKKYRSKHQLTSHKNVHTDNRPFKCDQCPKTFRSRTAFKMHQDEHQGIKRFSCQYCARKFQCHGNKLKHERRHKGIKNHKCEICDKAFIEKQELKNHLKVHEKRNQSLEKVQTSTVETQQDTAGLSVEPKLDETTKENDNVDDPQIKIL